MESSCHWLPHPSAPQSDADRGGEHMASMTRPADYLSVPEKCERVPFDE